jgi:hypothetical protein
MGFESHHLFRVQAIEHQRRRLAGEVVISLSGRTALLLAAYFCGLAVLGAMAFSVTLVGPQIAGHSRSSAGLSPARLVMTRIGASVAPMRTDSTRRGGT